MKSKYHLSVEIDKLTNSIVHIMSGESFSTDVASVTKTDIKNINRKSGWTFNWASEFRLKDRDVFKLTINSKPALIQGMMSISDLSDHFYLHLIEVAPFNFGRSKLYEGVAGNLFAFACKSSWDKGYQGFVSFTSKTRLIEHYEKALGATHIGNHKMVIFPLEALRLIKQYFPQ